MRVVDSSAWIEWLAGGPLKARIEPLLPDQSDWLVPTIVQYKLSKWLLANELVRDRGQRLIAYSTKCVVVPLSTELAIDASHCGRDYKLAAADAIVYATARSLGADVLTCDAHFEGLPRVIYLPKSGGDVHNPANRTPKSPPLTRP